MAHVHPGQAVILGTRPEVARLVTRNSTLPAGLHLRGTIEVIEPDFARHTQLLYLRTGAFFYAAVVPLDEPLGIGHPVEVLFPADQLLFFDADSERRIG
jgi:hypothetical protein